jgi:hypothetical protein
MIHELIQVNSYYTRSINLERDANSDEVLQAYIPTSRALQTLEKITHTFHSNKAVRTWSLVGPYGSGKSSFALFLSHLFDKLESQNERQQAQTILGKANIFLCHQFIQVTKNAGYCNVLLTGSPEPLAKRFVIALHKAARHYWSSRTGGYPEIVSILEQACHKENSATEIIDLLKQLQTALAESRNKGKGILIIIDELGKFLEYEARHQGANDIYLLQMLAELANAGHKVNVMLLVLMHQAFDQYAKGLTQQQKNEWLKVQGRFESITFLESAEQTLRVVAAAFTHSFSLAEQSQIKTEADTIAKILANQNALPNGLNAESASHIFSQCYPLHPLSLLILPVLCQKMAQNERTLFSYLGSDEAHGFKHSLHKLQQIGEWIYPHELFDYFVQNSPVASSDHLTYRRWLEVITALERLGDAPASQIQLLKSIGLFNIINAQGNFKASPELVALCLPDSENVEEVLAQLQTKAVLQYRKFNHEYRVWQGSDFDLESVLLETQQQSRIDSIAHILNQRKSLPPLVARKYSIQYATLRYFQPIFTDSSSYKKLNLEHNKAYIIFYLAETATDRTNFHTWQAENHKPLCIYVLHQDSSSLKAVLSETLALEKIQIENQILHTDPVAQRELKDRLNHNHQLEEQLLSAFLEQPERDSWFHGGQQKTLNNRRELQNLLSEILEQVYCQSPIIKNELINRDKPSAQANGAVKKLVGLLLNQGHVEELGFEKDKFPPEKSIYRALLKETKIHRTENGILSFYPPLENGYRLHLVWQGIDSFIQAQQGQQALTALYAHLQKPPFGIKAGVLPLLFISYYLVNQRRLALYEEKVFCPQLGEEQLEILLKRPELFSFEAFGAGIQAELFNQYLETLVGKIPNDKTTLVDIVKPLAKFRSNLPFYTLHTKNLDKQALAVRDAFAKAQSPIKLLFDYLPQACGYPPFTEQQHTLSGKEAEAFLNTLVNNLKQLQQAYPELLVSFQKELTDALELNPELSLPELRKEIKNRYQGLEKYSHDREGLQAFIRRLCDNKENDTSWLESVAALLGKAPPAKWKAENQALAAHQLEVLSDRLKQLQKVHVHQARVTNSESGTQAYLLRLVNEEHKELDTLGYIDPDLKAQAQQKIAQDFKVWDKKLLLAIAAEIVIASKD